MLDESTREAILRLAKQGHGKKKIAALVGASPGAVKRVMRLGRADVPALERAEKAEPYRTEIVELYASCKGNLVRVHEELTAGGAALSYQALTAFCRRHGIAHPPRKPAGQYHFDPGEEMQHDTSPHEAILAGRRCAVVTASLVLCHSRMTFAQMFPRFTRFHCKLFLTDAFTYFGGACGRAMIDNTHVIVSTGTGRDMVPAPEMAAFAERYGFEWRAHAVGDANRSARVERPFDYIDNNFLAGRSFDDWADLNRQLLAWCDRSNGTFRRLLHGAPRDLFVAERARLKPVPAWVPEVYLLHHRIVDNEGFVHVSRNRYSAPWQLMGRTLEVRETKDRIAIFEGPRRVGFHEKVIDPSGVRVIDPAHRPPREQGVFARRPGVEEERIASKSDEARAYLAVLRQRGRGSSRELRWLLRIVDDYPAPAVRGALEEATRYGMVDLERLERMVLRGVAATFFNLPARDDKDST
jgi:transposase